MVETRELRITMRYDNLYKYDVDVNCSYLNSTGVCSLEGGYAIALLRELVMFLNFRLTQLTDVNGYDFGNATKHGVDLFVGSYVLREARVKLVDPTLVTGFSRLVIFLNHEHESSNEDILIRPFKFSLWMGVLGVLTLSVIVLVIIHNINSHTHQITTTTSDIIFEGIAASLQKGTLVLHAVAGSTRFALFITSFCYIFSYIYYSGAIVSILTVGKAGINSLETLVSSEYSILLDKGYNNGSSSQIILEGLRQNDTLVDKLLKRASKTKIRFDTFEKSIIEVREKPVALITEDDSGLGAINSVIGLFPCSWSQIPVRGIKYPLSMFMRKRMPYRHEINAMLLKMTERGVMEYLKRKWIKQDSSCFQEKGVTKAAKLTNLWVGFVILGGGLILALLIAAMEKILGNQDQLSSTIEQQVIYNHITLEN